MRPFFMPQCLIYQFINAILSPERSRKHLDSFLSSFPHIRHTNESREIYR